MGAAEACAVMQQARCTTPDASKAVRDARGARGAPCCLTAVRLFAMGDPQDSVCVLFGHFEAHPVIAHT